MSYVVNVWCDECEPGYCIEDDLLRDDEDRPQVFATREEAERAAEDWIDGAPFTYSVLAATPERLG